MLQETHCLFFGSVAGESLPFSRICRLPYNPSVNQISFQIFFFGGGKKIGMEGTGLDDGALPFDGVGVPPPSPPYWTAMQGHSVKSCLSLKVSPHTHTDTHIHTHTQLRDNGAINLQQNYEKVGVYHKDYYTTY